MPCCMNDTAVQVTGRGRGAQGFPQQAAGLFCWLLSQLLGVKLWSPPLGIAG